jgi:hypothetical protein
MASVTQIPAYGIHYLYLFGSDSCAIEQVFAIYASVLELDEIGIVMNAKYAEKRAAEFLRAYCDPKFAANPPYEDWEQELHTPSAMKDRISPKALNPNKAPHKCHGSTQTLKCKPHSSPQSFWLLCLPPVVQENLFLLYSPTGLTSQKLIRYK